MEHVSVRGADVPALGLGTYRLRGQACVETVREALEMGYRHVDTAEFYDNHRAVGEGIAAADVDREEVFLTTKVWRSNLRYDQVLRSARQAVDELGVEYVDLLLIHWPNEAVPVEETLDAMAELQVEGTTRFVGVSNFSVAQLREAIEVADVPVLTDQVEYHPYTDRADLLEFCIENDILLTAYSPLAKGKVAGDDQLAAIGDRYGKSAAQVALRWLVQQETVAAVPKASSREHLAANLDVFDFELTGEEMNAVFEAQGGLVNRLREQDCQTHYRRRPTTRIPAIHTYPDRHGRVAHPDRRSSTISLERDAVVRQCDCRRRDHRHVELSEVAGAVQEDAHVDGPGVS